MFEYTAFTNKNISLEIFIICYWVILAYIFEACVYGKAKFWSILFCVRTSVNLITFSWTWHMADLFLHTYYLCCHRHCVFVIYILNSLFVFQFHSIIYAYFMTRLQAEPTHCWLLSIFVNVLFVCVLCNMFANFFVILMWTFLSFFGQWAIWRVYLLCIGHIRSWPNKHVSIWSGHYKYKILGRRQIIFFTLSVKNQFSPSFEAAKLTIFLKL